MKRLISGALCAILLSQPTLMTATEGGQWSISRFVPSVPCVDVSGTLANMKAYVPSGDAVIEHVKANPGAYTCAAFVVGCFVYALAADAEQDDTTAADENATAPKQETLQEKHMRKQREREIERMEQAVQNRQKQQDKAASATESAAPATTQEDSAEETRFDRDVRMADEAHNQFA